MRIGLDIDDVLYRTSEMESYFRSRGVKLKNLPSENYYDIKWIDEGAVKEVKECLTGHPDWEFVIITSRASTDYLDISLMSNSARRKLSDARKKTKQLVTSVLPCITSFHFTEQKASCMQTYDIDVLIDDNPCYIEQVRSETNKIAIQKLRQADTTNKMSFVDFSDLRTLLEAANKHHLAGETKYF